MADTLATVSLTFSVLSFLLLVVALAMSQFPDFRKTLASAGTASTTGGIAKVAALLGALAPDLTLLSGFASDLLNGSFRYSVTSLVGIGAVVVNWLLAGLIYGFGKTPAATAAPAPAAPAVAPAISAAADLLGVGGPRRTSGPGSVYSIATSGSSVRGGAKLAEFNPCTIRGLGMFENEKSPMGIAALATVFMIYLLDMTVGQKRSATEAGIYVGAAAGVYALTLFAYKEFGCYGGTFSAIAQSTVLPIVVGLAIGGGAYGLFKSYAPAYLPLDGHAIGSPSSPGTYAKCSAPNDQDQFVCDAYKDGKRISTAVV